MVTRAWFIAPMGMALAVTVAGCGGTGRQNTTANAGYASQNASVAGPTNQQVSDAQEKLQQLGFYDGPIDGIYGHYTIAAVRQFQARNALPQTGTLTSDTQQNLQTVYAKSNPPNNQPQTAQQPSPNNQPNENKQPNEQTGAAPAEPNSTGNQAPNAPAQPTH